MLLFVAADAMAAVIDPLQLLFLPTTRTTKAALEENNDCVHACVHICVGERYV